MQRNGHVGGVAEDIARRERKKKEDAELKRVRELTDTNAPLSVLSSIHIVFLIIQISISERCRTIVEDALRNVRGGEIVRTVQPGLFLAILLANVAELRGHSREHKLVQNKLIAMGFDEKHVNAALTSIRDISVSAALDWLCLLLTDEQLPKVSD